MNPSEAELTYPMADTVPALGTTIDIAPGVRWLRMGLPFALDHINLWLLRDRQDGIEGWTIVDCGIANDATRAAWERIFAERLDGLPVLRVISTHMHPDHIGLAHWLTERWGCRFWVSATDFYTAHVSVRSTVGFGGDRSAAFFASHGLLDPEALDKVRERANYYVSMVPQLPMSYRRLMDGMTLDIGGHAWRCIAGYGHAPEHMSLHAPALGLLISGDMVLPRISTNISVHDVEPESDPLALFLTSLKRYDGLAADTLVLPAHGKPFTGLHTRIRQLQAHHDERLADVLVACRAKPCHAAELLTLLFRRQLDLHQTTFAMGEAVAHLHALWHAGRLQRQLGGDGVYRFSAA